MVFVVHLKYIIFMLQDKQRHLVNNPCVIYWHLLSLLKLYSHIEWLVFQVIVITSFKGINDNILHFIKCVKELEQENREFMELRVNLNSVCCERDQAVQQLTELQASLASLREQQSMASKLRVITYRITVIASFECLVKWFICCD